jgi:hypothetical protein
MEHSLTREVIDVASTASDLVESVPAGSIGTDTHGINVQFLAAALKLPRGPAKDTVDLPLICS